MPKYIMNSGGFISFMAEFYRLRFLVCLFEFDKAYKSYIWYSESGTLLSQLKLCLQSAFFFFLHIESELIDPRKPSRFGNFTFFGDAFRLIKDLEEISVTQCPQEMPLHFYSAPCFFSFLLLHDVSYCWKLSLYVALEIIKDGEGGKISA